MITDTSQLMLRFAGKSRKGTGKYNWDYICCMGFPAGSSIRGLFAVADGSPSPTRGDRASEKAVEYLKSCFQQLRTQPLQPDNTNLMKQCFAEINNALINSDHSTTESEEETHPLLTTLTAGYVLDNMLFVGHTGTSVLYVIQDGKIQRLTEAHPTTIPEDTTDTENQPRPGVLGWDEKNLRADFFAFPLEKNTVFIFCTDGLGSRLTNLALVETWLETGSPEDTVEKLLERAESRGEPTDASAVVLQIASEEEPEKKFVEPIRYPGNVLFIKYFISTALLALLTILLLYRDPLLRWSIPGYAPVAEYKPKIRAESPKEPPRQPAAATLVSKIFISVIPSDAHVLVNGIKQDGSSPFSLEIPDGKTMKLRVERNGYIPHEETLMGMGDTSVSKLITLQEVKKEYGSLRIWCQEKCDAIFLDGGAVRTAFPRNYLQVEQLALGRHTVRAEAGKNAQEKRVLIRAEQPTELKFLFPHAAREETPVSENTIPPERPRTIPKTPEQIVRKETSPVTLPKVETKRAFFTVKTNVPGCTVMVFQNNQLVRTGFSGDQMDVPPGKYSIQVTKDGYEPVVREMELRERFSIIDIVLK